MRQVVQWSIAAAICGVSHPSVLGWQLARTDSPAEQVHEASHIVVGIVQVNPIQICPPARRGVFWGPVNAERYLKGTGPASIRVMTFAGDCLDVGPDGTWQRVIVSGHPTGAIPAGGTRVLLLLKHLHDQEFQPVVTSGIVELQPDTEERVLREIERLVEQDR